MLLEPLKELVRPYYLKYLYFRLNSRNCPREFTAWRDHPWIAMNPTVANLVPEPSAGAADILFLPMADWHGIRQRSQQLARGFASLGHRCFYLNPHLGREFAEAYPLSPKRVVSWLEPGILELHTHLPQEPVFHHRCLSDQEQEDVVGAMLELLHHTNSQKQVSTVSFPLWTDVAQRLRERTGAPIVYDCHDLLEGFRDIHPDLIELEERLFECADFVVFSAESLRDRHLERRPDLAARSLLIRNAVDLRQFSELQPNRRGPRVRIGYVGSLNFWFDSQAVRTAALAHPEWDFELVGPRTGTFPLAPVAGLPNVHFAGEVRHDEVPGWLERFDVATIPFQRIPLTEATNPVKLYEYFACGMPVVSTRLPEVERYSNLVYLSDSSQDFVRALEQAVAENDPHQRQARQRVARNESWTARCESLRDALSASLVPSR